MKKINLTNKRFGRLLVTNHYENIKGRLWWTCQCDCGNFKSIRSQCLISSNTRSCGCLEKEVRNKHIKDKTLPPGKANGNALYSTYKSHAKLRGLEFFLSKEEFLNITSKNCYYCNTIPKSKNYVNSRTNGPYIYNGIDRMDNNIGYLIENCVPCCKTCNFAKKKVHTYDFINWAKSIAKNHGMVDKC